MTSGQDCPEPTKDRVRLNHRAFAICRARGMSLADAAKAAGSRGTTGDGLTSSGKAMEARPEVAAMIRAERLRVAEAVQGDLDAAWTATVRWLRDVAEGRVPATNLDRLAVANVLGKTLGQFRRPVPVDDDEPIPFGSLLGTTPPPLVVEADARPSSAPDLAGSDDADGGRE